MAHQISVYSPYWEEWKRQEEEERNLKIRNRTVEPVNESWSSSLLGVQLNGSTTTARKENAGISRGGMMQLLVASRGRSGSRGSRRQDKKEICRKLELSAAFNQDDRDLQAEKVVHLSESGPPLPPPPPPVEEEVDRLRKKVAQLEKDNQKQATALKAKDRKLKLLSFQKTDVAVRSLLLFSRSRSFQENAERYCEALKIPSKVEFREELDFQKFLDSYPKSRAHFPLVLRNVTLAPRHSEDPENWDFLKAAMTFLKKTGNHIVSLKMEYPLQNECREWVLNIVAAHLGNLKQLKLDYVMETTPELYNNGQAWVHLRAALELLKIAELPQLKMVHLKMTHDIIAPSEFDLAANVDKWEETLHQSILGDSVPGRLEHFVVHTVFKQVEQKEEGGEWTLKGLPVARFRMWKFGKLC